MHPPKTAKQVTCIPWTRIRYCIGSLSRTLAKMAKPLTLLTRQKAKFEWTPTHHIAFLTLKESLTQAPILQYLDPAE